MENLRVRFITLYMPVDTIQLPYIVPKGMHSFKQAASFFDRFIAAIEAYAWRDEDYGPCSITLNGNWAERLVRPMNIPLMRIYEENEAQLRQLWREIQVGTISEMQSEAIEKELAAVMLSTQALAELLVIAAQKPRYQAKRVKRSWGS